jgi:uncharacterized membrane protein
MAKKLFPLIIVLGFSLLAGFSLIHSGLPPTHDGEYHVVRFIEFDKVLRSGNLYPRWAPDLNFGYGVPLFNYVYPLPNYLASFFHSFGISFIDAFKLIIFVAFVVSGIFSYLWLKILFGKKAAIVGSIFYLFSPYIFVDAYIRGSVGEMMALSLFPVFLWSVTELFNNNRRLFLPISCVILGLIIFSHNILGLMFFPVGIIYSFSIILMSKNKRNLIINLFAIALLGLGLSSIFWLPAILETKFTVGLQIFDYQRNFPEVYQLLIPSWGSGFFGGTSYDQMSVQVGVANIVAVFISLFALIKLYRKKEKYRYLLGLFFLMFLILIFLMLKISLPFWQHVPLMEYFQFPWRFLSIVILTCSFLAAGIIFVFKNKFLFLFLLILPIALGFGYAHATYFMQRTDNYYATRSNFIDGTNSIGNAFNTIWFRGINSKAKSLTRENNLISVSNVRKSPVKYEFEAVASKNLRLVLNIAYFPGWTVDIDNKQVNIGHDENGLITFNVSEGEHVISVVLKNTFVQLVSSFVSLISFILIVALIFKNWYIKGR